MPRKPEREELTNYYFGPGSPNDEVDGTIAFSKHHEHLNKIIGVVIAQERLIKVLGSEVSEAALSYIKSIYKGFKIQSVESLVLPPVEDPYDVLKPGIEDLSDVNANLPGIEDLSENSTDDYYTPDFGPLEDETR